MPTKDTQSETETEYVPYLPKKYDLALVNDLYSNDLAFIEKGELYVTVVGPGDNPATSTIPLASFCGLTVPGLTSFVNNKCPEPAEVAKLRKLQREYVAEFGEESAAIADKLAAVIKSAAANRA